MMKILLVLAVILTFAAAFSPVFAGDCDTGCGVFKGKFLAAPPALSKCSGRTSCAPV